MPTPEEQAQQKRTIERIVQQYLDGKNVPRSQRGYGPFVERPGQTIFTGGELQSRIYKHRKAGWMIRDDGFAEFGDGLFRGNFEIGGSQKTIDTTQDIQAALDDISANGGGTLYLKAGTYTLTSHILIPANVALVGVDRDSVIINCNSSYAVKITGSLVYNTGTVAINPGDTTVVGTGTTFTSAMIGSYIYLGTLGDFFWYQITAVADTTHLTIDVPYGAAAITGAAYYIADILQHGIISKVTITGATGSGLVIQYAREAVVDDIVVYGCGTGIDMDEALFSTLKFSLSANGVNLDMYKCSGFGLTFCDIGASTTGSNVVFELTGNSTFFDSIVYSGTSHGIEMTDCSNIAFLSVSVQANGGDGVNMDGCSTIQFTAMASTGNAGDGIELVADCTAIIMYGNTIVSNGAYGISVTAASDDSNIIGLNYLASNTSGEVSDSGTSTKIRSNIGVADN